MDLILAGPVILGSPALLVSPDVVQVFLAISVVSEAEVAVSVSQAEEISADQGAVEFRLAALEGTPLRSLRAIELYRLVPLGSRCRATPKRRKPRRSMAPRKHQAHPGAVPFPHHESQVKPRRVDPLTE